MHWNGGVVAVRSSQKGVGIGWDRLQSCSGVAAGRFPADCLLLPQERPGAGRQCKARTAALTHLVLFRSSFNTVVGEAGTFLASAPHTFSSF